MFRLFHRCRATIHAALAALIVTALSHCMWEDSRELAQTMSTLAQHRLALPSPIQAPVHDCGHESGCICRGATLLVALQVDHCQPQAAELLSPTENELSFFVADLSAECESQNDSDPHVPPLSGRQLRALYASLLI
jgi:hypothetical protein